MKVYFADKEFRNKSYPLECPYCQSFLCYQLLFFLNEKEREKFGESWEGGLIRWFCFSCISIFPGGDCKVTKLRNSYRIYSFFMNNSLSLNLKLNLFFSIKKKYPKFYKKIKEMIK